MSKFLLIQVVKPTVGKIKEVPICSDGVHPDRYSQLGHAKCAARIAFSRKSNIDIQDIVVKNEDGRTLFRANKFSGGIFER